MGDMGKLSRQEILLLLDLLSLKPVVLPNTEFPFTICVRTMGYREAEIGKLQAKLSIMLEVASKLENKGYTHG